MMRRIQASDWMDISDLSNSGVFTGMVGVFTANLYISLEYRSNIARIDNLKCQISKKGCQISKRGCQCRKSLFKYRS